jgi:hypothetical protein
MTVHYTPDYWHSCHCPVFWNKRALSNGPRCVGASPHFRLRLETDPVFETLCSFEITDDRQRQKLSNPKNKIYLKKAQKVHAEMTYLAHFTELMKPTSVRRLIVWDVYSILVKFFLMKEKLYYKWDVCSDRGLPSTVLNGRMDTSCAN